MNKALSLAAILQSLPAWIAAACAVAGLRTWQHQLHYKENYELARRLLRAAYRYRDSINEARFPISFQPDNTNGQESTHQSREQESWSKRFEAVNAAKRELRAELLEAEVVLGHKMMAQLEGLFECDKILYGCVLEHLDSITEPPDSDLNTKDARVARRKIMFARLNYQDDFSIRVAKALEPFEKDLRPMLGRKKPPKALRKSRA